MKQSHLMKAATIQHKLKTLQRAQQRQGFGSRFQRWERDAESKLRWIEYEKEHPPLKRAGFTHIALMCGLAIAAQSRGPTTY